MAKLSFTPYQLRFSLHFLTFIACSTTCILMGVYNNPFPDVDSTWVYGPFEGVTLAAYSVSIIFLATSELAIFYRRYSVFTSTWVHLPFGMLLVAVSIAGLVIYRPRLLVGYIIVFGPVPVVLAIYTAYIMQVAVPIFVFLDIALVLRHKEACYEPFEPERRPLLVKPLLGHSRPAYERSAILHRAYGKIVFQHTVFRKRPFESPIVAFIRGSIGLAVLVGLGIYAFDLLIVQPCREAMYLPIRYTLGARDRDDRIWLWQHYPTQVRQWFGDITVLVAPLGWGLPRIDFDGRNFSDAISAQTLSPNGSSSPCTKGLWIDRRNNPYATLNCSTPDASDSPQAIRISLNYTLASLPNTADNASTTAYAWFTNSTFELTQPFFDEMLASMESVPLSRGAHVRGSLRFAVRKVINQGWLDILGISTEYTQFNTYLLRDVVNDAFSTDSGANDTFDLTIFPTFDTENTLFVEDYRQFTTLSSLASVGGVFTILDGVFAMIFGSALIATVLGSKPISPFGAMGLLVRAQLRRGIRERYPHLADEMAPGSGGMAEFLKDVSLELNILEDGHRSLPVPVLQSAGATDKEEPTTQQMPLLA